MEMMHEFKLSAPIKQADLSPKESQKLIQKVLTTYPSRSYACHSN
jgi:hypothetical protein